MFLCFLQVRLFNERQQHFALTSSVAILKSGISSYAGISLASFDHQRKPERSFFAPTFEDQKSVQYKEKWAVDVIRNWQAAREKNHILLLRPGSVFKACQVLKKGQRIAQPLPKLLPSKGHANNRTSTCSSVAFLR